MAEGRRQFLKRCGLAALTIVAYATSTRISGSTADPIDERLIAFARQLFPYDVEDSIYISVVDAVISNPAYLDALKECADALDGFLEMNDAQQIDAIRALESATFFEEVVNAVRSELHVRPELWMVIGYEGPSLQFGGYAREKPASLQWLDHQ